jgi:hypothetical protein
MYAVLNSKLYNNNNKLEKKITITMSKHFDDREPVYEPFVFSISDEEINRLIYKSVDQYKDRLKELKKQRIRQNRGRGKDLIGVVSPKGLIE